MPLHLEGKLMLQIRKEQLEALSKVPESVFTEKMMLHIRKHFPSHYEALGEENSRKLIGHGIERGKHHGFISERNACKFIDLMLCFGIDFDTDKKHRWAVEILSKTWINARSKMDALFDAGLKNLK
jgi:hypothetical protein